MRQTNNGINQKSANLIVLEHEIRVLRREKGRGTGETGEVVQCKTGQAGIPEGGEGRVIGGREPGDRHSR